MPRIALASVLAVTLLAAPGAWAAPPEDSAPAAGPDSATAAAPWIPISEIPRNLDKTRLFLRNLDRRLEAAGADTTISGGLASMREGLDQLLETPVAENPERASGRALRDLEGDCLRRQTKLVDWANSLEQTAGELADQRSALLESRSAWERTRAELAGQEIASGLLAEVDSVLARHGRIAKDLDGRYSAALDLRTQVSEETDRVSGVLDRLVGVQSPSFWALLRPERPPIWRLVQETKGAGERATRMRSTLEEALSPLSDFTADHAPNLVAHGLLFAGLLAMILVARHRRQRWEAEGDAQAAAPSIIDRPFAAALIGALVFYRQFYPFAPSIVGVLTRAISIPALLRLAPQVIPRRYLRSVWALAILHLLDTAEFLFLEDPVLRRVHLMVVSLLGLTSAIMLRRRDAGSESERERNVRRGTAWVAGAIFAVALVTNVYGAVELARWCTDGVLHLLFLGIVVIIASRVVENLVEIALRIAPLRHLRSVRTHRALIERRLAKFVRLLIGFVGIRAAMVFFGTERVIRDGFTVLMDIGGTVGSITLTFGHLFAFFVTVWISFHVSRFLRFVLGEDLLPQVSLPRGVPQTILRLTHYAVISLGFLLALAAGGVELGKLTILAGGLGVGLGFGLQTIVNNFISGLILMFERPVQVGDTIEVGALIGRVQNIGIRASTVRTYSGAEVVVPNANLISNEVINWTLSDRRRRIELPVGVAYGSDPEQVRQILLAAAGSHADVLEEPTPLAFFLGFGDSALNFEARFWTKEFEEWQRVRGEVAAEVQRSLADAGIVIPFPQRTVHVRSADRLPSAAGPRPDAGDSP